ncbi:MAG TPA: ORF6N domain-containing protein [Gemmatimonadales bacterium]|nr:ORF6N domain-containing protein [Gemmatimonadales bacterium]
MSMEPSAAVARVIVTVRGFRAILSSDLAPIYGVQPKVLNQAVKRNAERFPPDFAFRLSKDDMTAIRRSRSQSVTLKRGAHVKYAPLAFTEHGALMAATVLNSRRAVQMSIFVVRAFLRLREGSSAKPSC